MNLISRFNSHNRPRQVMLVALGLIMATIAGFLTSYDASTVLTLVIAIAVVLIILNYPTLGLLLVTILLYLPVFEVVGFGPLEFSITALPVAALFIVVIMRFVEKKQSLQWSVWQKLLVVLVGNGFLVATLFSTKPSVSLRFIPNLTIYIAMLIIVNVLVRRYEQLVTLTKAIVILGVMAFVWKEVDSLIGLPRLSGVNGINFMHHPVFALCMTAVILPVHGFSLRWRIFMGLAATLMVADFIIYETRSAWLAGLVVIVLIFTRARLSRIILAGIVVAGILGVFLLQYQERVQSNIIDTRLTIISLQEEQGTGEMSQGDRIREIAFRAGFRMIQERPWVGWGSNSFVHLKPEFTIHAEEKLVAGSGWNSWLVLLAEMGIIGSLPVWTLFVTPLVIIWLRLRSNPDQRLYLAYGFAVAVIGLAVHLFFIDLLFGSYTWLHVSLAMAATGLCTVHEMRNEA